jgi:hypothetical protein
MKLAALLDKEPKYNVASKNDVVCRQNCAC